MILDSRKHDVHEPSTAAGVTNDAELREGTLLAGRYLVMKRIAAGGMGEVFLAFDLKFEQVLAEVDTCVSR